MWCLVQGASRGIGLGLVRALLERGEGVIATCRDPTTADALADLARGAPERMLVERLDVTDEASVEAAATRVEAATDGLGLLINAAGLLHDEGMSPERSLRDIDPQSIRRSFDVNAVGPLLMAKHFVDQLTAGDPAVFATLSARVGSITDNRLGGWYAYRGSKAAQNMFTKTLAIEVERRRKPVMVVALHPGTVDTGLSRPFTKNYAPEKLFAADQAAKQLLDVIDGVRTGKKNGQFLAYDGSTIAW